MTEAERIAQELVEAIDGFPQATKLEQEAAALLRSQAAEIERLRGVEAENETLHKVVFTQLDAEIASLRAEVERLREALEDLLDGVPPFGMAKMRTPR